MDLDTSVLLSYISILLRIEREEKRYPGIRSKEDAAFFQKLCKAEVKLESIVMEIVDKVLSDADIYADIARARSEDKKPGGL